MTGAVRDDTTKAIASALLAAARVMNQARVHEMLRRRAGVDLDRSGATLLYKLHSEGEDIRLTELAERLGIDSTTVTRKVQQLERAGLVRRAADPGDARAFRLKLTREGRTSINRLLEARQSWLDELLEGWSAADRTEFARLLELFATTLTRHGEIRHEH